MENQKLFTDYLYDHEKNLANSVYLSQPIDGKYHDITWAEAMEQARKVANFLKQQGFKKGDRIAILSKNCAEWFITDFAIVMAGLVSVPLFAAQHPETIAYILAHSEAKMIFVGKLDNWAMQEQALPKEIKRVAFPYKNSMPADVQWNDILEKYSPIKENYRPDPDDLYSILYTSGTTGNPKGVMYTFQKLASLLYWLNEEVEKGYYTYPVHGRLISYLPLAHCMERLAIEQASLFFKMRVYFVESLETFPRDLEFASPSVFIAVPRLWVQFQMGILHKLPQKKLDTLLKIPVISSLIKGKIKKALGLNKVEDLIISGSAPLSPIVIQWYRKLGINIREGYGLTENLIWGTYNREVSKDGSIGRPRDGSDIKIGKDGEILIKSDVMMTGYYNDPKATKDAFTKDGYLKTGDKGYFDDEGYLFIQGRVKDTFKTDKGEFIEPVHIENKFAKNTNIEQLCLIGLYLPQPVIIVSLSDAAKARGREVVASELQITLDEINENLTKFEKISHIYVAQDHWTPENGMTTPTLKIKRNKVIEVYLDKVKDAIQGEDTIIWE
jgi:long-chain acyl-CoA synthetase